MNHKELAVVLGENHNAAFEGFASYFGSWRSGSARGLSNTGTATPGSGSGRPAAIYAARTDTAVRREPSFGYTRASR
ncbi:hypothetical protein SPHINGOR109_11332 [Sphingorhabdus sp. 109]|nr:hypothetical protein SPHINGOR109_11332 [Sphingorhabdus sp. 109]